MNIIVCIKQVPNPDITFANFRIDEVNNTVIPPSSLAPVINGFDEQALEAALRIKDKHPDTRVTVLTMGDDLRMDIAIKPLSMGADSLVILQGCGVTNGDSYATASVLHAAIKKLGDFDLVLCGRQASDWDQGQVPLILAELLDIAVVTIAKKVTVENGALTVERVVVDGSETVQATLPALVTVSNELGAPRYATMKGISAARGKTPTVWSANDLNIESAPQEEKSRLVRLKVFVPQKNSKCEFISAPSLAEAGCALAVRLREDKVI